MPALEAGHRFERYRVLRLLGSGVSGESYEAEDPVLQRTVTLKLIQPGIVLPEAARRQFFREMQGISALSHPYLAAILDYGEVDGQLYVVRRFVEAGSLLGNEGRTSYRPPLPVANAITYAYQLSQALQNIHNYDYVHGSLTFSNILVLHVSKAENGAGRAPFLLADVSTTYFVRRFGQPQTTRLPLTAAPEQLGGRVTRASDQYALAVLLYFWLTGRPPFVGSSKEIEQLKLTEAIPAPKSLNRGMTLEQENILRRALRAHPEKRYPSIIEFTEALIASLSHLSPIAAPSEPIAQVAATTFITEERPAVKPETTLERGPRPQILPDVPQPIPEPTPVPPQPQPEPEPAPELAPPEPDTEPEIRPQPAPDIITPIPDPDPTPIPEHLPTPSEEPAKKEEPRPSQSRATDWDGRPVVKQAPTAYFIITSPYSKEPREVIVHLEETTLGRAGSSDILLDYDTFTSRHHALLKHVGATYIIYDRYSAYGTAVNGHMLDKDAGYTLKDGDTIRIGVYELVFRLKTMAQDGSVSSEHALS
ncbi:MAG TPA: FHA domain-containing serine/threonine-protein kinase [Ktedonobacteraceae bacterium]|nr:FHA domain-containing serine/threonine-protein kinase [Ktedonobacteraceae bacterium]